MIASIKMLASKIRSWISRRREDQEFQQELSAHLEMLTQENIQRGMSLNDANRAARIRLGGLTQLYETNRELRGLPMLETFLHDFRYALRMLRKNPGFTAVAVLTLALGIGANTAIFSVVQAVFLRSLPVEHPEQLVSIGWSHSDWPRGLMQSGYGNSLSYGSFQTLRAHNSSLSSIFAFAPFGFNSTNTNVPVNGQATLVDGAMVTGGFFSGLGIRPALGRTISEQDDGEGMPRVAVLGYSYWATRFSGDPRIIGSTININNVPCAIVGIVPASFRGMIPGRSFDVYVSLSDGHGLTPYGSRLTKNPLHDDLWFWMMVIGRMKPGITPETARADLNATFQSYLTSNVLHGYKVEKLPYITISPAGKGLDRLRQAIADPITLLQWMVALILLMSCANVAALLMARARSRSAEMGIRMAIGGSRRRLVSQLLVENLTLALTGSALGLAFAQWGAWTLILLLSPRGAPLSVDVHVDMRVLLFAAGLALLTTILFGLGPSISAT